MVRADFVNYGWLKVVDGEVVEVSNSSKPEGTGLARRSAAVV